MIFHKEYQIVFRSTKPSDNIRLVKLHGRLDTPGSAQIEHELAACCATAGARVLIDMTNVEHLSSFGMRMLLLGARELATRGAHMYLVAPRPHIKDKLKITGMAWAIPIYDTLTEAEFELRSSPWL